MAADKLALNTADIEIVKILFKSLVNSDVNQFYFEVSLCVSVPFSYENIHCFSEYHEAFQSKIPQHKHKERPIIIGFGPAGIFAALTLIEQGYSPIIFEQGKELNKRNMDVEAFMKDRILVPDSNIQFGEGGAGTYSDGKLFSRSNNSIQGTKVLSTLIAFGAPEHIGYTAKPHLGTDRMRAIVLNIRNFILANGGEIHFSSQLTSILVCNNAVCGVGINNTFECTTSALFLALGNSARNTFSYLHNAGFALQSKPITVGVRVEHPVEIINKLRYGEKYYKDSRLGAAPYSFTYTNRQTGRGVYSFCMCPGGEVVNASSEKGHLVLNGMSYSARNSPFSNSALVVPCRAKDYGSQHPLAGIEFQKEIEQKAFLAGGRNWAIPAQNLTDFLKSTPSVSLQTNSCKTGVTPFDLSSILPSFISQSLKEAFSTWAKTYPTFVSENGILFGVETRTSSPVKIVRNSAFESVSCKGVFPIGEGSGYSGGIVSSAIDAIKAVNSFCDLK